MTQRIRIRTPSRLHFGLLGWGAEALRQFGGVGLMVDDPGLEVVVQPSSHWEAVGVLSERSILIAGEVAERLTSLGYDVKPCRIENIRIPQAHLGLGVGTQLSMAIALAIGEFSGLVDPGVEILARIAGRGLRSGIGIHGFYEGGLIVDSGRRRKEEIPTRILRLELPREWSVLVLIPTHRPGLHGREEVMAFKRLPPVPIGMTQRLCQLLLLGLLPAVIEKDLSAFGESLEEIQQVVGAAFAPVQGGQFAEPETEAIIGQMKRIGLFGAGQSSWGPAIYAFSEEDRAQRIRIRNHLLERYEIQEENIFWTQGSTRGADLAHEECV